MDHAIDLSPILPGRLHYSESPTDLTVVIRTSSSFPLDIGEVKSQELHGAVTHRSHRLGARSLSVALVEAHFFFIISPDMSPKAYLLALILTRVNVSGPCGALERWPPSRGPKDSKLITEKP